MKLNLNSNTLRWLWKVSGRYKTSVAGLLVIQIIFGLCGVASAILFMSLIDSATAKQLDVFIQVGLCIAGLFLFENLLRIFNRHLHEWASASLENLFKERLFSVLLKKDHATVTATHSGEWISRLTSDVSVVTGGIIDILPGLGGMLARLGSALAALIVLEPAFLAILIPAGLFILLMTALLRKVLKRLHKKVQEAYGAVLSFLQERLESLMIIRIFSMEQKTCKDAAEKMKQHKAARMQRTVFSNLCNFGFGIVADGGYLLGAVYCGYGILKGTLSYGTFTAVLQLVGQVQSPFAMLTGIIPRYFAMTASAERLMEAEAYPDDNDGSPVEAKEVRRFYAEEFQALGVRDAVFSYRRRGKDGVTAEQLQVIDHLNFEVKKGEYVAFTGQSGSGKSTLFKLLMSLYPLDEGERYIRSENAEYPLTAAWRGLFAYVPQGNQLISGSIREIVAFGDQDAMQQDERIERALQIACADEFVSALELGMDTRLGERGAGLSEGQMQRIAIARAVFSDRPVLILDESTSALDEKTEQKLLDNLRRMTSKTVLLITHRPAALEICDRVIDLSSQTADAAPQTE